MEYNGFSVEKRSEAMASAIIDFAATMGLDANKVSKQLFDKGMLDSAGAQKYRATQSQAIFDALPNKDAVITLAEEEAKLVAAFEAVCKEIETRKSNFRVDVSSVDYAAEKADITNVARWLEMLKTALDAASASAEASVNAPDENGATLVSQKAGYEMAITSKHNTLRGMLDAAGLNSYNVTSDGKLVLRPAAVTPAAHTSGKGKKNPQKIADDKGNVREFSTLLDAFRTLRAEGIEPFQKLPEDTRYIEPFVRWPKLLAAAGLHLVK